MSETLQSEKIGPVDVAVIAFDGDDLNRDIAPALTDLQARGTVQVIDMAFVRKDPSWTISIIELADERADGRADDALDQVMESQYDLLSEADLTDIASGLEPGSAAMVVVWENSWAARFASAVAECRGRVAMLERIPRENVARALAALDH